MTQATRILCLTSDTLNRMCKSVASMGIVVMLFCILLQVAARYIFNEPPAWPEELARYAMIWAGFTGATVAFKSKSDPTLLNAETLAQPWMRRAAQWLEAIAVSLFWLPILYVMPDFLALHSTRASDALEIPNIAIVSIMPVCIIIILLHMIVRILPQKN